MKPCTNCGHAYSAHMAVAQGVQCIAATRKPGLLAEERAMCGCTDYHEAAEQAALL